jgi:CheY-like chemotaxis protein
MSAPCTHILLVEDDPDCREVVSEYLDLMGYEVRTAADGVEALDALRARRLPDVVLTDLAMPRMTGQQLVAAMRADPRLAAIPIVVMSGAIEVARPIGATAMVLKPFDPDALLRTLEQCVGARIAVAV